MESKAEQVPEGFRVLTEGQAKILYKEEKLEADDNNKIKTNKGKRNATEQNDVRGTVFYNPVQEFNRDFSILAIREFAKLKEEERTAKGKEFDGINILEALSATGLRSVRYMKEIDKIKTLVANDIDPTATELMQKNFNFNNIPNEKYKIFTDDAVDLMNTMRKEKNFFDVVDLDPYGTAVPFLESSLSAMADGGLLAVTFTDMAVLCARNPHVCFYKYGAAPLSKRYCHEMALRIVLHMISQMANRHQKYIEPMVSLTVDFYIRLFIRVRDGPKKCHASITKYSHVFQCMECEAHYLQPFALHMEQEVTFNDQGEKRRRKRLAGESKLQDQRKEEDKTEEEEEEEVKEVNGAKFKDKYQLAKVKVPHQCTVCDGPLIMGGPIWNSKIHNIEFVQRLLEVARKNADKAYVGKKEVDLGTTERIQAILTSIIDEDVVNVPLSYDLSQIASTIKIQNPRKNQLIAAFRSLGYLVTQTYYDPKLYKTNAPPDVVYDIFKAWKHQTFKGDEASIFKNVSQNSVAYRILKAEAKVEPNFDEESVRTQITIQKQKKYLPNPEPNWGPRARATGNK